ncbi:MAG TPA: GNAT family N-acetyltransferase [Cellvibrio sp.]|nr:GNAT family N-acetyltransferase [Cellvibrio sp.]
MDTEVFIASSDEDINSAFPAFKELRPALEYDNFLSQVRRQEAQSYNILVLRHQGIIKSAAGFRVCEFLAWGRVLYIDDLTTLQEARGQGFASELLDWLIDHAKSSGCASVHLDSGYARYAAHRVYLQKGFQLNAHHFALAF